MLALLVVALLTALATGIVPRVYADTFGHTSNAGMTAFSGSGFIVFERFVASSSGTLTTISFYATSGGNGNAGIYADVSNSPGNLIAQGAAKAISSGVNDFAIPGSIAITSGTYYWLAFEISGGSFYYGPAGTGRRGYGSATCCTLPNTIPVAGIDTLSYAIFATYSPSGPDFTITASPTSQSVGAGSTASFTLNLVAAGGFIETVSLSVTSGCPVDDTCTVTPNSITSFPGSSTLSVPTLITTSGSYSVVVHAQSTSKSHDVTATLSVTPPASYAFNVKSGATQIVVTLTYAWTGSGTPPAGSITLAAQGGSPTYAESGAAVYDRTSIAVSGASKTYTILHRVTFTVSGIISPQVWTALVSLASVSTYNVIIEVS